MKLHSSHVGALVLGLAAGYAIAAWGPADYTFTPKLNALRTRLHSQTLARAAAQEATITWRRTVDLQRTAFVTALRDSTAKYQRVQAIQARTNQQLLAQLAVAAPQEHPALITEISTGIERQELACTLAITSCQQAQDSLKVQVADRDSIIGARDTALAAADSLARDAVADDSMNVARAARAERKTKLVTVVGVLLVVLSLFR